MEVPRRGRFAFRPENEPFHDPDRPRPVRGIGAREGEGPDLVQRPYPGLDFLPRFEAGKADDMLVGMSRDDRFRRPAGPVSLESRS